MNRGLNILLALALVVSMGLVVTGPMAAPAAAQPVTSGLVLHLDASDVDSVILDNGEVAEWRDVSGENNHATQATPANRPEYVPGELFGKPVVRFDGAATHLVAPAVLSGAVEASAFIVFKAPDVTSDLWLMGQWSPNCFLQFFRNAQVDVFLRPNPYIRVNLQGPAISDDTGHLSSWVLQDITPPTLKAWVDGTLAGTDTETGFAGIGTHTDFGIGADTSTGARVFDGDIAEILIYDRALTDQERGDVEDYLTSKWLQEPDEVWVCDTDGDDAYPGTEAYPFKTIQHGIDTVAAGGTVNVKPGTYTVADGFANGRCIYIDKDLTILGAGSGSTILDAEHRYSVTHAPGPFQQHCTIIWNEADTLVIEGITVRRGDYGIRNISPTTPGGSLTSVEFIDVVADDNHGHGIIFWDDVETVVLTDCEANNNGDHGIHFAVDRVFESVVLTDTSANDNGLVGFGCRGTIHDLSITGGTFSNNSGGEFLYAYGDLRGPYYGFGLDLRHCAGTVAGIIAQGNGFGGPHVTSPADASYAGGGAGIVVKHHGGGLLANDIVITDADLQGNMNGLWIEDPDSVVNWGAGANWNGTVEIVNSNIVGNVEFGMYNNLNPVVIDATYNWWGDCRGPDHAGNPYPTTGDAVSDNVLYYPWLDAPYPDGVAADLLYWHSADQTAAEGTTTAGSVDAPANLQEGDLIILVVVQQNSRHSANPGISTPTGFTLIRSEQDPASPHRPEIAAFWKIATDSEPANYTFTVTEECPEGTFSHWKAVAGRVTGYDPTNPIGNDSGTNSGINGVTSLAIPSITTSRDNVLLVGAVIARGQGAGNVPTDIAEPATMAQLWSIDGTANGMAGEPGTGGGAEVLAAQGATGARTFDWTNTARAAGLMFEILPRPISVTNAAADPPETKVDHETAFSVDVSGSVGPLTYLWTFGDGAFSSDEAPTHTYGAAGTYPVMVTVTDCLGHTDSDTFSLVVNPALSVSGAAAVPDPTKVGFATDFSVTVTGGVAPHVYAWDFGDGIGTSTDASPTYNYAADGTYTVTVTVTDVLDNVDSDSFSLTVNPALSVTGAIADPDPTWVGEPTDFSVTVSGGVGPYDYDWDFGDGGSSTDASPTHTYGTGGTFTVTVTVTDSLNNVQSDSFVLTSHRLFGVGAYDPANRRFHLMDQLVTGPADDTCTLSNRVTLLPVAGDWDGDGFHGVGGYDEARGTFYIKYDLDDGAADIDFRLSWARRGWYPVAGDWTGDGDYGVGVYDPSSRTFYLKNDLDDTAADLTFTLSWARSTWLPVAGDWNGDGQYGVGLYDPATGTFYLRNDLTAGPANHTFDISGARRGWLPLAGDWSGDGEHGVGLYDPITGTYYLTDDLDDGDINYTFSLTGARRGWYPVAGFWTNWA